jgi:hypothetical protein
MARAAVLEILVRMFDPGDVLRPEERGRRSLADPGVLRHREVAIG